MRRAGRDRAVVLVRGRADRSIGTDREDGGVASDRAFVLVDPATVRHRFEKRAERLGRDAGNQVPVLLLQGTKDRVNPLAGAERLREADPAHTQLLTIPGVDHDWFDADRPLYLMASRLSETFQLARMLRQVSPDGDSFTPSDGPVTGPLAGPRTVSWPEFRSVEGLHPPGIFNSNEKRIRPSAAVRIRIHFGDWPVYWRFSCTTDGGTPLAPCRTSTPTQATEGLSEPTWIHHCFQDVPSRRAAPVPA